MFRFTVYYTTESSMVFLSDGGRLQQEIAYNKRILGEEFGSTSEIILQTGDHILTPSSLLLHYEAVKAATKVKVHVKNTYVNKWRVTHGPSYLSKSTFIGFPSV